MDFEKIISEYKTTTCVMSVEKYEDGGYGNIRIVAGNKAHCEEMEKVMHRPFIPDSPYEEYLPQNNNFEDFCYRCAILGQPLHTYVPLPQMGLWLAIFLLPLQSDKENVGYCIYSYDVSPEADAEQRADISVENSSAVLKTCVKLRSSDNKRETFAEVMEDIRQICDSDDCCIMLTDHEKKSCSSLCEAIRPGCNIQPIEAYISEGSYEFTQTWDAVIGDSTCLIIKDEHDWDWLRSVHPVWAESLIANKIKSIVLFPLKYNNVLLGYLWAINFNVEDTVKIKETLELTTFFVASEIANYQLLDRLEIMGSIDSLTGVKNRNKMNSMIDDIVSGKISMPSPYAVVFADLNGLKNVNDVHGHSDGDRILKSAAEILKKTFPESDVFRAGGDEFMVIATGLDEATLENRKNQVKELAAAVKDLYFAIGSHLANDNNEILQAMRMADQGMYSDKKEYYANHPDRRRR
ncbi:MAG: sensor domain-containing diguanylate cyclase [Lachnospiraceae bacterium]|nr:sensor domain-containing diguanylate cyclase [Lachnospiraceae bacterium]